MNAVKYEMNGTIYNTLAEAPKGAKVIIVPETEPFKSNKAFIERKRAIFRERARENKGAGN